MFRGRSGYKRILQIRKRTFSCNIDSEFLKKTLVGLTGIDSPSGYCDKAIAYVGEIAASLGYRFGVTNKGCGVIYVDGREKGKKVGLAAHTDTLGLMVRSTIVRTAKSNSQR